MVSQTEARIPSLPGTGRLEQLLSDELALRNAAGTGEEATPGVGHKLVEHVELSQSVEYLDEAGPRIALIADEKDSGVILYALAPRRPPLCREIHPVIV